ncbi:MAG: hypothetical protein P1P86_10435 [Bacteroidales bacterium]|nr:hypothetical protein [Bacteroidales bacterium]
MKNIKILRILTILLAISLSVVSIAGGFFPGTYARDNPSLGAQGAGQDLVDLFLGVPLLLISFYYTARGSRAAALIYGGTLFYIMYSFVIYCFGFHFNRFFLLYCLTLSLSLYAFILFFSELRQQKVERWFEGAPVRLVSIYLIVVALIFYVLWLKSIIPAIIQNQVPGDVSDYGLLVNPVHVIDLVFALPGLIIGAVLIRIERGSGYIIASIALVFMVLLTLALAAMVLLLMVRGIQEDFTISLVFGVLTLTSISFLLLLFRSLKAKGTV